MIYSSFIFVYFVPTNSLSVSSLFLDCDRLDLDLRVDHHQRLALLAKVAIFGPKKMALRVAKSKF